MEIKYDKLRVELCQNQFILIMSDNFDEKVCNGLINQKFRQLLVWQYLHNYQYFLPITKQCFICSVCGVKRLH